MDTLPRGAWVLAVDYLFAALIYTMVGRFVLGLFAPADWDNYIWRFFRRVTDPVLAVTNRLTPSFMVEPLLPLVAVWWLFVARILFNVAADPIYRANILIVLHLLGVVPESWLAGVGQATR
jgi:uncharacterized protein YggT (Ycf19 family)